MRVRPRYQLLEIWRGVVAESFHDGQWHWTGHGGRNSISDGEQLLCILAPATAIPSFGIDDPDATSDDVLSALRGLGNSLDIPLTIIHALIEFMTTYAEEDGTPIFAGEGYFAVPDNARADKLTDQQHTMPVVDSFAVSVSLSLAAIGFARTFRASVPQQPRLIAHADKLEHLARARLSAAMVALLRSFTVWVFEGDSRDGSALIRMLEADGPPGRVVKRFRDALREVESTMRGLTLGVPEGTITDLKRPTMMFECGWSWSVVRDAPEVPTTEQVGKQISGDAEPGAYIYFTVVALDAIEGLLSERTKLLGLLNDEQQRLAEALNTRWNLTQNYWAAVATFGDRERWPLENIPWQRTNENESDYFSLLVSSIVVRKLVRDRASDRELDRVGRVLQSLAERGRITYRAYRGDRAPGLHHPGVKIDLMTPDSDMPPVAWIMSDYAPLLMERAVSLAGLLRDVELRDKMLSLADRTWEHLAGRRLDRPVGDLWDAPRKIFPDLDTGSDSYSPPSWYFTKRVVDAVMSSAVLIGSRPLYYEGLAYQALELLATAEHLFDQEVFNNPVDPGPAVAQRLQSLETRLKRARSVSGDVPAVAVSLAQDVLRELDQLAAARQDPDGR